MTRFRWAALAWLCLIAYGSLLPWEFAAPATPFSWTGFLEVPSAGWERIAREDGLAHLLGYGVLALLCRMAIARFPDREPHPVLRDIPVLVFCVLLSLFSEYLQQYLPSREVSSGDTIASAIGALFGLAGYHAFGATTLDVASDPHLSRQTRIAYVLAIYSLVYVALMLFPFDFVLSRAELAQAWSEQRHAWLWSPAGCHSLASCFSRLALEAALAAPVGAWWAMRHGGKGPVIGAIGLASVVAIAIELLQLFLLSGTSQGASAVFRMIGLVSGAMLPQRFTSVSGMPFRSLVRPACAVLVPLYLFSVALAAGWFRGGRLSAETALSKLAGLRFIPFYYHHHVGETSAIVSVLLQSALYAPVGVIVCLWGASRKSPAQTAGPMAALVAMLIGLVAEAGKLWVDGQRPDPTNVLIAALAAWLAYRVSAWLFAAPPGEKHSKPRQADPASSGAGTRQEIRAISRLTAASTGQRFLGSILLLLAAWGAFNYSLGLLPLAAAMVPSALIVWHRPHWAVAVILAALPVFNLAPWSGQFFIDEFDILVAATLGIAWLRSERASAIRPGQASGVLLLGLLLLAWLVAMARGLMPLVPFDANAFATYFSPYNALRVGKGLLWALLLAPLLLDRKPERHSAMPVVIGMSVGLALTALAAVWERFLFTGLFNYAHDYRITGLFSSVHTGGAFVEAYIATATPFLAPLVVLSRSRPVAIVAGIIFIGACYGVMVTYARAGYLALGVAIAIVAGGMLIQSLRQRARHSGRWLQRWGAVAMLIAAAAVALPVALGPYAMSRFATLDKDMDTRTRHWQGAINMMDGDSGTQFFGMGLGTFPRTYLARNTDGARPTTFAFIQEDGNTFLRLGSGELLYITQRIPIQHDTVYRLRLDLRNPGGGDPALTIPICEKFILHSFECHWISAEPKQAGGQWVTQKIEFNSGKVGTALGRFGLGRPTQLAIFNPSPHTIVDVDNIQLFDTHGKDLLANGSFNEGIDRWFFSTDSHLSWHPKNLFVQLFFEQGALGLFLFVLSAAVALYRSGRGALAGDIMSLAMLASLAGFLSIGMFDSLFDDPRMSLLYFVILVLALDAPRPAGSNDPNLYPTAHSPRK